MFVVSINCLHFDIDKYSWGRIEHTEHSTEPSYIYKAKVTSRSFHKYKVQFQF